VSLLSPTARSLDADGYLLLPAFAEPHAHLDKAFLAERVENPTGDLMGAILAMDVARHTITLDDTIERAERAARLLAANGCTAIRTHVDLTLAARLTSVAALIEVRERLRDLVEIQVVALCAWPSIGDLGADQRALVREAVDLGIDVIGGCPHLESDPAAANDNLLTLAADAGLPIDMMETSFFLSRQTLVPTNQAAGMALWREKLFAAMSRNAASATAFFKIPTNRVVELGTRIEL